MGHSSDVVVEAQELGAGRPVVFIHGLTFDRHLLMESTEPLFAEPTAPGARRFYVDLPGHGATRADERAASAEGLVASLLAWYDRVGGAEAPIIVGHSYGAYLALGIAACRRVAGLVLVTPVVEPDVARRSPSPRRIIRGDEPLHYSAGEPERATFEEVAVLQTGAALASYQRLVHPASDRTDRAFLEAVRSCYVFSAPLFSRIDPATPIAVLCARDDHWCGYSDALAVVRAFPQSELTVLPDCGQLLPLEQAERYRAFVSQALRRTP